MPLVPTGCAKRSAYERQEGLHRELRLLQDVGERRPLHRTVRWHDDLERFLRGVLLEADVTSVLADHDPAVALESPDDAIVGKLWDFVQTAISTSSAACVTSRAARSSATGSRYNWIASRMFASASSRVSPSLMQPGRPGTVTV